MENSLGHDYFPHYASKILPYSLQACYKTKKADCSNAVFNFFYLFGYYFLGYPVGNSHISVLNAID